MAVLLRSEVDRARKQEQQLRDAMSRATRNLFPLSNG